MNDGSPSPLERLRYWMDALPSVMVAYSGGVDSAVVMAVAHERLGPRALACIGASPSYPRREMRAAVELAERLGATRVVDTEEHLDPNYAANPVNRCYFCKNELFGRLRRLADAEGWAAVVDGTHADDHGDDRPGKIAAQERGVRSPLAELGLGKRDVREIAKALDLPVWDKPAMACLSSRVPHGTPIAPPLLRQIEAAEDVLVELGFAQFRVRHHGDLARIELPVGDFAAALEHRERIVAGVGAAGYKHVTLDWAGFRAAPVTPATPALALVPLRVDGRLVAGGGAKIGSR